MRETFLDFGNGQSELWKTIMDEWFLRIADFRHTLQQWISQRPGRLRAEYELGLEHGRT